MEAPRSTDVTLALYLKLLQAAGAASSHHGSHEQDTAYYDRFGETILASQGTPLASMVLLSGRSDLLEQGIQHGNSEVVVVTLRLCALTMAANLPPSPDSHPAFFTCFAKLLGAGSEPPPSTPPRVREAAMLALSRGCVGSKLTSWTSMRLATLIKSLSATMADGALHRLAASASSLLAALVCRFGQPALTAVEIDLGSALSGTPCPPTQLKLSLLDFITALICDQRAPAQLVTELLTAERRATLLGWLKDPDTVVRGRTSSALILLSRVNGLAYLGGEEAVLRYAQALCDSADNFAFAAELLGGLAFVSPQPLQAALDTLCAQFASLSEGGIGSRQRCVSLAALLTAIDTRLNDKQNFPPLLATSLVSLLRRFKFDATSLFAPQRLFKVLLRLFERRANQYPHNLLAEAVSLLLPQLRDLHEQRLHQLAVDVLQCLGALLPVLIAPSVSTPSATATLANFAEFAVARLKESDGAWEVRDSIAELLGHWVALPSLREWCLRAELVDGLRLLVSQPDLEPFVYATVSRTLAGYAATDTGWHFMVKHEQVYLACCAAALSASESLLRKSALEMLSQALQHPHSAGATLAFMCAQQCSVQISRLATDDDFEVRGALISLLTAHVWPNAAFFTLGGDHILQTAFADSHRLVRREACAAGQRLAHSNASVPASDQFQQFIARVAALPLDEMRNGSGVEEVYGNDVEEFLHPQSHANEMDCD